MNGDADTMPLPFIELSNNRQHSLIYTRAHAHTHTHTHIHTHKHTHTHIHTFTHTKRAHTHAHVHTHAHARTHARTHSILTHLHTYTLTHLHTYTLTHTRTCIVIFLLHLPDRLDEVTTHVNRHLPNYKYPQHPPPRLLIIDHTRLEGLGPCRYNTLTNQL
jgi:hypothetical protein